MDNSPKPISEQQQQQPLPSPGAAARGQVTLPQNEQPQPSASLRPRKSFWKSISGIFRTKSSKKKKQMMQQKLDEKNRASEMKEDENKQNVEDSSKEDAMMSAETKKRSTKEDKTEEDSSEEDHVIVKDKKSNTIVQFQKEHVSEPLQAPRSEVSAGSGHEADDEAENDDQNEQSAVKKIRNAINQLQKEPEHLKTDDDKDSILKKALIKLDPPEEASNEDTYSFSYSETFSADEEDEKVEETKVQDPKVNPPTQEETKETISCRILTSDNTSIEFHPSKSLSGTVRQEVRTFVVDNQDPNNKENLKKEAIFPPQDPKTIFLSSSAGQVGSGQAAPSDEAIQEWAKEDQEKQEKIQKTSGSQNLENSDYEDCVEEEPEGGSEEGPVESDSKTTANTSLRSKVTGFITCSSNLDSNHGVPTTNSRENPTPPDQGITKIPQPPQIRPKIKNEFQKQATSKIDPNMEDQTKLGVDQSATKKTEGTKNEDQDSLSPSNSKEPKDSTTFHVFHSSICPSRPRGLFKSKQLYENIEDLSQEELKELDELAKYNNILNDKFESFGKYSRLKEPKVKIVENLKKNPQTKAELPQNQLEDKQIDLPDFPKVPEIEPILPEEVDKICDPNSVTIEGSGKSEAPEGILKKGKSSPTKVNLAVNFAENADIVGFIQEEEDLKSDITSDDYLNPPFYFSSDYKVEEKSDLEAFWQKSLAENLEFEIQKPSEPRNIPVVNRWEFIGADMNLAKYDSDMFFLQNWSEDLKFPNSEIPKDPKTEQETLRGSIDIKGLGSESSWTTVEEVVSKTVSSRNVSNIYENLDENSKSQIQKESLGKVPENFQTSIKVPEAPKLQEVNGNLQETKPQENTFAPNEFHKVPNAFHDSANLSRTFQKVPEASTVDKNEFQENTFPPNELYRTPNVLHDSANLSKTFHKVPEVSAVEKTKFQENTFAHNELYRTPNDLSKPFQEIPEAPTPEEILTGSKPDPSKLSDNDVQQLAQNVFDKLMEASNNEVEKQLQNLENAPNNILQNSEKLISAEKVAEVPVLISDEINSAEKVEEVPIQKLEEINSAEVPKVPDNVPVLTSEEQIKLDNWKGVIGKDPVFLKDRQGQIIDKVLSDMQKEWIETEKKIKDQIKAQKQNEFSEVKIPQEKPKVQKEKELENVDEELIILEEKEVSSIFKNTGKRNSSHLTIAENQLKNLTEDSNPKIKSGSSIVLKNIEENLQNYQHQLSAEYLNHSISESGSSNTQFYRRNFERTKEKNLLEARCEEILDDFCSVECLKRTKGVLHLKEQAALASPTSSCSSNLLRSPNSSKSNTEKVDREEFIAADKNQGVLHEKDRDSCAEKASGNDVESFYSSEAENGSTKQKILQNEDTFQENAEEAKPIHAETIELSEESKKPSGMACRNIPGREVEFLDQIDEVPQDAENRSNLSTQKICQNEEAFQENQMESLPRSDLVIGEAQPICAENAEFSKEPEKPSGIPCRNIPVIEAEFPMSNVVPMLVPEVLKQSSSSPDVSPTEEQVPVEEKEVSKDPLAKEIDDLVDKLKSGLKASEPKPEPKREITYSINFSPSIGFDVFGFRDTDSLSPSQISSRGNSQYIKTYHISPIYPQKTAKPKALEKEKVETSPSKVEKESSAEKTGESSVSNPEVTSSENGKDPKLENSSENGEDPKELQVEKASEFQENENSLQEQDSAFPENFQMEAKGQNSTNQLPEENIQFLGHWKTFASPLQEISQNLASAEEPEDSQKSSTSPGIQNLDKNSSDLQEDKLEEHHSCSLGLLAVSAEKYYRNPLGPEEDINEMKVYDDMDFSSRKIIMAQKKGTLPENISNPTLPPSIAETNQASGKGSAELLVNAESQERNQTSGKPSAELLERNQTSGKGSAEPLEPVERNQTSGKPSAELLERDQTSGKGSAEPLEPVERNQTSGKPSAELLERNQTSGKGSAEPLEPVERNQTSGKPSAEHLERNQTSGKGSAEPLEPVERNQTSGKGYAESLIQKEVPPRLVEINQASLEPAEPISAMENVIQEAMMIGSYLHEEHQHRFGSGTFLEEKDSFDQHSKDLSMRLLSALKGQKEPSCATFRTQNEVIGQSSKQPTEYPQNTGYTSMENECSIMIDSEEVSEFLNDADHESVGFEKDSFQEEPTTETLMEEPKFQLPEANQPFPDHSEDPQSDPNPFEGLSNDSKNAETTSNPNLEIPDISDASENNMFDQEEISRAPSDDSTSDRVSLPEVEGVPEGPVEPKMEDMEKDRSNEGSIEKIDGSRSFLEDNREFKEDQKLSRNSEVEKIPDVTSGNQNGSLIVFADNSQMEGSSPSEFQTPSNIQGTLEIPSINQSHLTFTIQTDQSFVEHPKTADSSEVQWSAIISTLGQVPIRPKTPLSMRDQKSFQEALSNFVSANNSPRPISPNSKILEESVDLRLEAPFCLLDEMENKMADDGKNLEGTEADNKSSKTQIRNSDIFKNPIPIASNVSKDEKMEEEVPNLEHCSIGKVSSTSGTSSNDSTIMDTSGTSINRSSNQLESFKDFLDEVGPIYQIKLDNKLELHSVEQNLDNPDPKMEPYVEQDLQDFIRETIFRNLLIGLSVEAPEKLLEPNMEFGWGSCDPIMEVPEADMEEIKGEGSRAFQENLQAIGSKKRFQLNEKGSKGFQEDLRTFGSNLMEVPEAHLEEIKQKAGCRDFQEDLSTIGSNLMDVPEAHLEEIKQKEGSRDFQEDLSTIGSNFMDVPEAHLEEIKQKEGSRDFQEDLSTIGSNLMEIPQLDVEKLEEVESSRSNHTSNSEESFQDVKDHNLFPSSDPTRWTYYPKKYDHVPKMQYIGTCSNFPYSDLIWFERNENSTFSKPLYNTIFLDKPSLENPSNSEALLELISPFGSSKIDGASWKLQENNISNQKNEREPFGSPRNDGTSWKLQEDQGKVPFGSPRIDSALWKLQENEDSLSGQNNSDPKIKKNISGNTSGTFGVLMENTLELPQKEVESSNTSINGSTSKSIQNPIGLDSPSRKICQETLGIPCTANCDMCFCNSTLFGSGILSTHACRCKETTSGNTSSARKDSKEKIGPTTNVYQTYWAFPHYNITETGNSGPSRTRTRSRSPIRMDIPRENDPRMETASVDSVKENEVTSQFLEDKSPRPNIVFAATSGTYFQTYFREKDNDFVVSYKPILDGKETVLTPEKSNQEISSPNMEDQTSSTLKKSRKAVCLLKHLEFREKKESTEDQPDLRDSFDILFGEKEVVYPVPSNSPSIIDCESIKSLKTILKTELERLNKATQVKDLFQGLQLDEKVDDTLILLQMVKYKLTEALKEQISTEDSSTSGLGNSNPEVSITVHPVSDGKKRKEKRASKRSKKKSLLQNILSPIQPLSSETKLKLSNLAAQKASIFNFAHVLTYKIPQKGTDSKSLVSKLSSKDLKELPITISGLQTKHLEEVDSIFDLENEIKEMVSDLMQDIDELKTMCLNACNLPDSAFEENDSNNDSATLVIKDILDEILEDVFQKVDQYKEDSKIEELKKLKEVEVFEERKSSSNIVSGIIDKLLDKILEKFEPPETVGDQEEASSISKSILDDVLDKVFCEVEDQKERNLFSGEPQPSGNFHEVLSKEEMLPPENGGSRSLANASDFHEVSSKERTTGITLPLENGFKSQERKTSGNTLPLEKGLEHQGDKTTGITLPLEKGFKSQEKNTSGNTLPLEKGLVPQGDKTTGITLPLERGFKSQERKTSGGTLPLETGVEPQGDRTTGITLPLEKAMELQKTSGNALFMGNVFKPNGEKTSGTALPLEKDLKSQKAFKMALPLEHAEKRAYYFGEQTLQYIAQNKSGDQQEMNELHSILEEIEDHNYSLAENKSYSEATLSGHTKTDLSNLKLNLRAEKSVTINSEIQKGDKLPDPKRKGTENTQSNSKTMLQEDSIERPSILKVGGSKDNSEEHQKTFPNNTTNSGSTKNSSKTNLQATCSEKLKTLEVGASKNDSEGPQNVSGTLSTPKGSTSRQKLQAGFEKGLNLEIGGFKNDSEELQNFVNNSAPKGKAQEDPGSTQNASKTNLGVERSVPMGSGGSKKYSEEVQNFVNNSAPKGKVQEDPGSSQNASITNLGVERSVPMGSGGSKKYSEELQNFGRSFIDEILERVFQMTEIKNGAPKNGSPSTQKPALRNPVVEKISRSESNVMETQKGPSITITTYCSKCFSKKKLNKKDTTLSTYLKNSIDFIQNVNAEMCEYDYVSCLEDTAENEVRRSEEQRTSQIYNVTVSHQNPDARSQSPRSETGAIPKIAPKPQQKSSREVPKCSKECPTPSKEGSISSRKVLRKSRSPKRPISSLFDYKILLEDTEKMKRNWSASKLFCSHLSKKESKEILSSVLQHTLQEDKQKRIIDKFEELKFFIVKQIEEVIQKKREDKYRRRYELLEEREVFKLEQEEIRNMISRKIKSHKQKVTTSNPVPNVLPNVTSNLVPNGTSNLVPNGTSNLVPNGTSNLVPNVIPNGTSNPVPIQNGTSNAVPIPNGTANPVSIILPNGTSNPVPNGTPETKNPFLNIMPHVPNASLERGSKQKDPNLIKEKSQMSLFDLFSNKKEVPENSQQKREVLDPPKINGKEVPQEGKMDPSKGIEKPASGNEVLCVPINSSINGKELQTKIIGTSKKAFPDGSKKWYMNMMGKKSDKKLIFNSQKWTDFQKGPSDFQKEPSDFQKGPSDFQTGPSDFQKGHSDFQKGPTVFQKGPSDFQTGPSGFQNGPCDSQKWTDVQKGSSDFQKGPSDSHKWVSDFQNGLSNFEKGPSNSQKSTDPIESSSGSPQSSSKYTAEDMYAQFEKCFCFLENTGSQYESNDALHKDFWVQKPSGTKSSADGTYSRVDLIHMEDSSNLSDTIPENGSHALPNKYFPQEDFCSGIKNTPDGNGNLSTMGLFQLEDTDTSYLSGTIPDSFQSGTTSLRTFQNIISVVTPEEKLNSSIQKDKDNFEDCFEEFHEDVELPGTWKPHASEKTIVELYKEKSLAATSIPSEMSNYKDSLPNVPGSIISPGSSAESKTLEKPKSNTAPVSVSPKITSAKVEKTKSEDEKFQEVERLKELINCIIFGTDPYQIKEMQREEGFYKFVEQENQKYIIRKDGESSQGLKMEGTSESKFLTEVLPSTKHSKKKYQKDEDSRRKRAFLEQQQRLKTVIDYLLNQIEQGVDKSLHKPRSIEINEEMFLESLKSQEELFPVTNIHKEKMEQSNSSQIQNPQSTSRNMESFGKTSGFRNQDMGNQLEPNWKSTSGFNQSSQIHGNEASGFQGIFGYQIPGNHASGKLSSGFNQQFHANQTSGFNQSIPGNQASGFNQQIPGNQTSGFNQSVPGNQVSGFNQQFHANQTSGFSQSIPGNQFSGFKQQHHGNQIPGNHASGFSQQIPGNQASGNQIPGNQASGNQTSGNQACGNQFSGFKQQHHGNQIPGNQASEFSQQIPGNQASGNQFSGFKQQHHGNQIPGNQTSGFSQQIPGNQASGNQFSGFKQQFNRNQIPGNQPSGLNHPILGSPTSGLSNHQILGSHSSGFSFLHKTFGKLQKFSNEEFGPTENQIQDNSFLL